MAGRVLWDVDTQVDFMLPEGKLYVPGAEQLVAALDPDEVILFGVATDICNDAAVRGLLQRGRRVTFVEDAARGLDEERVAACLKAWRDGGVEFTTTAAAVDHIAG